MCIWVLRIVFVWLLSSTRTQFPSKIIINKFLFDNEVANWRTAKEELAYLDSSRTPEISHGFQDCFPKSPRQSTAVGKN